MTPEQIALARHALGLRDGRTVSYRNTFVAGNRHPDYANWIAMTQAGNAIRRDGEKLMFGGSDLFHLTRSGAEKALRKGESLDREDFPAAVAA